jgi:hypothetical protein
MYQKTTKLLFAKKYTKNFHSMAIQNILKLGIGYEYLPSGNPVSLYIGQNSLYILTYGKIQT